MERSRSQQIDEEAQLIFMRLKPRGWVAREDRPDYGIDYRVQVFERKDPSSCGDLFAPTVAVSDRFAVQLKGKERVPAKGAYVTYPLETHHLKYYVDVETDPVFLIVVDVMTEDAFWVFTQKYAEEELGDANWRSKNAITIRLPRANLLRFDEGFLQMIRRSIEYMATRRPVAINSAMVAAQRKLERLDPRFDVELTAEVGHLTRRFTLKPSATMDCRFDFSADGERGRDFLLGKQVRFLPGEVRFDSVLFDKVPQVEGLIQVGGEAQATLLLARKDAPTKGLFFRGVMTNGIGGVSYESEPGPIRLSSDVLFSESSDPCVKCSMRFDLSFWYGKPVPDLTRFDEVQDFFSFYGGCTASTQWIVNGLPGESGEMGLHPLSDDLQRLLRAIRLAREIGDRLGFYPTLPKSFGEIHWISIERLHSLLFGGEWKHDGDGDNITVSWSLGGEWQAWQKQLRGRRHHRVSLRGRFTKDFMFLEHRVTLVMTEITIDRVRYRHRTADDGKCVELVFSGVEQSRVVLRATGEIDANHAVGNSEDNPIHIVLHVDPLT
ncbi:DUF4365 domain-containing protein [Sorangium sp. So ce269]